MFNFYIFINTDNYWFAYSSPVIKCFGFCLSPPPNRNIVQYYPRHVKCKHCARVHSSLHIITPEFCRLIIQESQVTVVD